MYSLVCQCNFALPAQLCTGLFFIHIELKLWLRNDFLYQKWGAGGGGQIN